ncbi:MAG TPA: aldose epimerase family protein [Gemmataceae bacterium]|jgi:aldose 1-epimerase|nr:aldose epimerase family protein [Gemmataceae bacterium]
MNRVLAGLLVLAVVGPASAAGTVTKKPFGQTRDGTPVELYTLTNSRGMRAAVMTYGGILVELTAPDRNGQYSNVVLGFDSLEPYLGGHPLFGALVGRYANRIGGARLMLDGRTIELPKNSGKHHIHGGPNGFDKVVWQAEPLTTDPGPAVRLTHVSPDGHNGFPGHLTVRVTYTLTDNDELRLDYRATTDKPTVVNLTNHSYFNLAGPGRGDVLAHVVQINADRFTPADADLIPTGEIKSVAGTPLDFRTPTPIGQRISDEFLRPARGYDHNFVLNKSGNELAVAARVTEPTTGRVLEVLTTEPGVQFYTANGMNVRSPGPGGVRYASRGGFCLEAQHYPDSPNKSNFPTTVLRPGKEFKSVTVFRFSAK